MAFGIAGAVFLSTAVMAMGARQSFDKKLALSILFSQRSPAGTAEDCIAQCQPMADRDPLIKYKTLLRWYTS